MPARPVYFIPGVGETVLAQTTFPNEVVWVGAAVCILGRFGLLRLAPNGVDPGPPDGGELRATELIIAFASTPTSYLRVQLEPDNYSIRGWVWDWRKSILTAGDELAQFIRTYDDADNPCSLICHSGGGLVARRAWSQLVATGQQGLIRRIVTIGTPHWGSYIIADVFAGVSPIIDALYSFNQVIGVYATNISLSALYRGWTRNQIRDILLTFPSFYELLPVVGAPDSMGDPFRVDLFNSGNWGNGVFPDQNWLIHAFGPYRAWVLSPQSLPPDDVMTTVGSVGHLTPYRLADVTRLGEPRALARNNEGDGTVTLASSQLAGSQQVRITSEHSNQYPDSVTNGNARIWIEAQRSPTPIPPPAQVDARIVPATLPPLPGTPVIPAPIPPGGGRMIVGDC